MPDLGPNIPPKQIKLGSSKTPKGVVDKIANAGASELVLTLPKSGSVLDQKANEEANTAGDNLPKLKAGVEGVKDIPEPPPPRDKSGGRKT